MDSGDLTHVTNETAPCSERLPDFLILGAMKSATSTLHDQLALQPGFFMSTPKEVHFFSDDDVWEQGKSWYSNHFADASADDLCGESSTHYSKQPTYPEAIERIERTLVNPRFVYVMRHPIDRLQSHYRHALLEAETNMTLDEAIAGGLPGLVDYGRYAFQLGPYLEAFGRESVLPVFFDRLTKFPQQTLSEICAFLGYEGTPVWHESVKSNVSSDRLTKNPKRDRVKALRLYGHVRKLTPEALVEVARRSWRVAPTADLDEAELQRIEPLFDADLAILGEWLGVELTCSNFKDVTTAHPAGWDRVSASETATR